MLIPVGTLHGHEDLAREEASGERDAEVDRHALRNGTDGDVDHGAFKPEPGGEDGAKKYA